MISTVSIMTSSVIARTPLLDRSRCDTRTRSDCNNPASRSSYRNGSILHAGPGSNSLDVLASFRSRRQATCLAGKLLAFFHGHAPQLDRVLMEVRDHERRLACHEL